MSQVSFQSSVKKYRERLPVGTVPNGEMHPVTVPADKMHPIGTVSMQKMLPRKDCPCE